ncbi:hypothetical protein, partial [Alistipes finegoldii]|uniref:hypothetical protein n=1 Tax=Alistipes finegoldii TaxID=214856 RepID=UPI002586A653
IFHKKHPKSVQLLGCSTKSAGRKKRRKKAPEKIGREKTGGSETGTKKGNTESDCCPGSRVSSPT